MFKSLVVFFVVAQFSLSAGAADVCSSFLQESEIQNQMNYSTESLCIVSKDAVPYLQNSEFVGETDHETYGRILVYKNSVEPYALTVVSEDLAVMMSDENQVIPFIIAVVAADLSIISAWVLTDMYSK